MKVKAEDDFVGVNVHLTGYEVATAIDAYLVARGLHVSGPRTVLVNGKLCESGRVWVDPAGYVIHKGEKIKGISSINTE